MIGGGFSGNFPRKPGKGKKGEPLGVVPGKPKPMQSVQPERTGKGRGILGTSEARINAEIRGPKGNPIYTQKAEPSVKQESFNGILPAIQSPPTESQKTSSPVGRYSGMGMAGIGQREDNTVKVTPTLLSRNEQITLGAPDGSKGWWRRWASREEFEQAKKEGGVGVRWVGPIFDESGYGEAFRNYVSAVHTAGMPTVSRGISFGEPQVNYGKPGKVSRQTLNLGIPCSAQVTYSPPNNFKNFMDANSYNIGMFVWEMDRLPHEWVSLCNGMDEIWVPCKWNAEVCQRSKVTKPIHVFGHCANPEEFTNISPLTIPGIDPSWFRFYSIFQWTERKNPGGLIRAYLKAFTAKDPVVLILKTYGQNYSKEEETKVRAEIENIRREVGGNQPRIALIMRALSRDQLLSLHKLGDCFVLPHRSEGWGLPHFEAAMMGKPVITTAYGGNMDFCKAEHTYLVDYTTIPNKGMEWFRWYSPDMTWANPSMETCAEHMRHVFENRDEASDKGQMSKKYVMDNFSWNKIGAEMKIRMGQIISAI